MTIYLVLRGERYTVNTVLSAHETLEGARSAVLLNMAVPEDWTEQDPPAEGAAVSWINHSPNYLCIRTIEVGP